ncbi:hypothetical protein BBI01_03370 [Chryseobacterium artocarpi]|uniref:Bacteriocin n=1 Tax=Chryseobacterium artocarpi TaxID=1414727 RepID=A0A1B9A0Y8_9FLAO|nr:hypothetical protein [Chryseobacterium artocarpi]OCA77499.1 hypothetical protein BBI01_03370 [Chryseobacterium artocarpi]
MKTLKKISRENLKTVNGSGIIPMDLSLDPVKACVTCGTGSESCYTDPGGDYDKAKKMAKYLCPA